MRDQMTPDVVGAISAPVITTALAARLELKTETVFLWTGVGAIQPTGSGDSLLDGNTFDPLQPGIVAEIGENTFSYTGSEELTITLAMPATPDIALAAALIYPNEYQSRTAVIWRALMLPKSDPLAAPVWIFRRIRTGKIDKLEETNDGSTHNLVITIESHQANISNASNQTYLNQRTYDPNDSSQDFAVSIANGKPAPAATNPLTAGGYAGSGVGYNKFEGPSLDLV